MNIEFTKEEAGQILGLLDMALGVAPVGQRMAVAAVILPLAVRIETAMKAVEEKPKP